MLQRLREICPDSQTAEDKQQVRRAVAWKPRHSAEDDCENYRCDEGLHHHPSNPKRSLFVDKLDVALYQNPEQVAILPKFANVERCPAFCRSNAKSGLLLPGLRPNWGRI